MAITKAYTTEHGLECPNFYLVVAEASFCKNDLARGVLLGFKDVAARDAELKPVLQWHFAFHYDMNSPLNIIAQAYLAVKNNPDYSICTDV